MKKNKIIDTIAEIHLSSGMIIKEECNYQALLFNINDFDDEYLKSPNYIIPKINIDDIKIKKIEEEIEEI